MKIIWKGKGLNEKGYNSQGKCIIECDKKYLRPSEVDILHGDFTKAKNILGWKPESNIDQLISEMINFEQSN